MPEQIEVTYATAQNPAENRTRYARSLGELEAVLEQLASEVGVSTRSGLIGRIAGAVPADMHDHGDLERDVSFPVVAEYAGEYRSGLAYLL